MRTSSAHLPFFSSTLLAGAASLALIGCATPPASPSAAPPPSTQLLVAPPPPAAPLPSLSIVEGNAWTGQMAATTKAAQQAALDEGEIEVQRTTDNRLLIRIPADAAFESRTGRPKPRLTRYCQALATVLTARPELRLEVAAYTTHQGSEGANLRRTEQQAQAVKQLLVQLGVASDGIQAAGRGSSSPAADEVAAWSAPTGPGANRRVEMLIAHPLEQMSR